MKIMNKLEWWSPEKVAQKARALGRPVKKPDFAVFMERTLADAGWIALAGAFDAFMAEARKGPVDPAAGGGVLKKIERAIGVGYPWLGNLLVLDAGRLDPESIAMLSVLGIPDPRACRDAYLEAGACALAVLENARYQMTRLTGFLAIEEKALAAYHRQCDALFERAIEACEVLSRRQPTAPGRKRKGKAGKR